MNSDDKSSNPVNTTIYTKEDGVQIVSANDIDPEHIDWMWEGWLARGKIHILAGPSTAGKTHIAIDFASKLSNGEKVNVCWPDKSPAPSGKVFIWSDEDSIKETILPRLMAAGAARDKVKFITEYIKFNRSRPFDFKTDCDDLSNTIDKIGGADLVIIDPIISAISGSANSNAAVRESLGKLNNICIRHQCAILGIHHLNKYSKGKSPLERVTGSLAFGAFPRVVMVAVKVEGSDPPSSVVVRAKTTNSKQDGGFEYYIESKNILSKGVIFKSSCIRWDENPLTGTDSEILDFAESGKAGKRLRSIRKAEGFFMEQLSNGPMPSNDLVKLALESGIKKSVLHDAAQNLQLEHIKETNVKYGHWNTRLPEHSKQIQEDEKLNSTKAESSLVQSTLDSGSIKNINENTSERDQTEIELHTSMYESIKKNSPIDNFQYISNFSDQQLDTFFSIIDNESLHKMHEQIPNLYKNYSTITKDSIGENITKAVVSAYKKTFSIELNKYKNKHDLELAKIYTEKCNSTINSESYNLFLVSVLHEIFISRGYDKNKISEKIINLHNSR